ncbi:uncharacterized protein LOC109826701 [Asparagus officinalis]|uniref:uncharacterized protein LOC109826701 n=1 Tax=Asparagus officinalis TaxID=4686 RepID=UPI00098E4B56|nr:uncharacterized protein LOC109826701 [Asparagus officinalis]
MEDLLLVLQVVNISSVPPSAEDEVRAAKLTLGSREAIEASMARPTENQVGSQEGPLTRLAKHLHKTRPLRKWWRKVEVELACKARYNYLEEQLSVEMRSVSDHFHYPPRVANCLEALLDIKEQGWRHELSSGSGVEGEELNSEAEEGSAEEAGEAGEGSAKQAGEGLARDGWASLPEKKGEGDKPEVQSTLVPPTSNAPPLLVPGPV